MAQEQQLILNRYRPISEAGSGGFATVQMAWDTRIQRRVAIKCIALDESDQYRLMQEYQAGRNAADLDSEEELPLPPVSLENIPGLDEARTAAMLSDPHIVGVFDFEVQGATAYLIMEYIDGLTLTQLLKTYGTDLSLDTLAAIFTSIAAALETAHENQVLHLDIKPDNILINRQGQVKVTDFGLATLSDAMGFASAAGGTIGYMPLEQMRQLSLDARCDEWALASVSYEMLTGSNPFIASNLKQAQSAIEDAELVLPSLCRDDLDAGIDDVIFYALDPDREERYESIADFAEEMEPFLGNSARGHKELAMLVGQAYGEIDADEEAPAQKTRWRDREHISAFDRIGARTTAILVRLWSVLGVAMLSFVALMSIPSVQGFGNPLFWGLFALCLVAAALKPHLGTLLGLGVLCVALFFNHAVVVGILLLFAAGSWWFFIARFGDIQANTALSPLIFGSFGFAMITPLLCGFALRVRDAVANTAFAAFLGIILAGFGSTSLMGWDLLGFFASGNFAIQQNIVTLLTNPLTWCIIIGWLLAAFIVSLFCVRETRLFAGFGVFMASLILGAAIVLGTGFASGFVNWIPSIELIVPTVGAGIVMLVACTLGVPVRYIDE